MNYAIDSLNQLDFIIHSGMMGMSIMLAFTMLMFMFQPNINPSDWLEEQEYNLALWELFVYNKTNVYLNEHGHVLGYTLAPAVLHNHEGQTSHSARRAAVVAACKGMSS